MTGLKLALTNAVIVIGSLVIIVVQWPEAMKPRGYGGGYDQGPAASIFLALLLTGIPVVLYAVGVHVALSHWLFRPGELKAYRARQLVKSIPTKKPAAQQTAANAVDHDD